MRKDILEFAKEKYFNGHSDTRSVQENFDLLTSFIQDSADKHIQSKTSRSVTSIPWITPEVRRKIRRKNKTHAKAKKTGSSKLRSKFETLRREIKADVRKQHDLYVNNLVVFKLDTQFQLLLMTVFAIVKLRMKKTQWNFRGILIDWVPGQGSGVWDFNLSNAIWCSWQENGSRRSMLHIP